ncbi:MAG: LysR family transcriptional regulator [Gammaproteobacteria bacterium]|nr:LysR family transcriptional regulator [Gammaproteobacteria bacterium]MCW8910942.1 LysR family transcriptional regulator [Gammaproteobacteria bacterium]MCW9006075.1 LysR family transcriptional regulator [Gammaproteobacteria bacterium]MCW9056881.1 LysR family transcriptional regulator [Gammaproteobacteria bacterium]
MDVGLLKAFLEVYRSRHFGHAAKNLFISQSAVSARIRQLEDELGVKLFTRDRNNIELTTAGKRFLIYAENILNTWNRARQEIAIPEGIDILLSIAALPSLWDIFLENWLSWVHKNNTATALQADVMRTDSLMRNLLDGTLDLGFVFDPPKTPRLLVKELIPVPLIMVSSKKNISAEEAVKDDYIFVDWGTSFSMIHARQHPDIPAPKLRANVGRIALSFLGRCGGAAYLPEAMVNDQLNSTLFRVEDAPIIHKDAYAIYSKTSSKQETIEKVLSWFDKA